MRKGTTRMKTRKQKTRKMKTIKYRNRRHIKLFGGTGTVDNAYLEHGITDPETRKKLGFDPLPPEPPPLPPPAPSKSLPAPSKSSVKWKNQHGGNLSETTVFPRFDRYSEQFDRDPRDKLAMWRLSKAK